MRLIKLHEFRWRDKCYPVKEQKTVWTVWQKIMTILKSNDNNYSRWCIISAIYEVLIWLKLKSSQILVWKVKKGANRPPGEWMIAGGMSAHLCDKGFLSSIWKKQKNRGFYVRWCVTRRSITPLHQTSPWPRWIPKAWLTLCNNCQHQLQGQPVLL